MQIEKFAEEILGERKINILGVKVDPVSMAQAVEQVVEWGVKRDGKTRYVCVSGVH